MPEVLRIGHYFAYYQLVKRRLEEAVDDGRATVEIYPKPCAQCDVCNWWQVCDKQRLDDDRLSLVAGISKRQRTELKGWEITTLTGVCWQRC